MSISYRSTRLSSGLVVASPDLPDLRERRRAFCPPFGSPFAAPMGGGGKTRYTLTLQPDGTTGKDCHLNSSAPTYNYGAYTQLLTQSVEPGLIRFDITTIPSGAVCISAILSLFHFSAGTSNARTITVYSVAVGNASWIQGTKNGALAGAGEPCWNALAANGAGGVTVAWAGSAGLGTAVTDYESMPMGSCVANRSDPEGTKYQFALPNVRVQAWFGAINTNYGMKISSDNGNINICSSNHTTAAYRPKLVVVYDA